LAITERWKLEKLKTPLPIAPSAKSSTFWPKALTPFPHQIEAVRFALKRFKIARAVYIYADPGTGKTIFAALLLNFLNIKKPTRAYFVTPPFLRANVEAEFKKWSKYSVHILPDTIFHNDKVIKKLRSDMLVHKAYRKILFVDEAHRFKNEKARRTTTLVRRIAPSMDKIVFMSGSAAPNSRPIEIWPILRYFAPDVFGTNFFQFALKFCGAEKVVIGYDRFRQKEKIRWKYSGFTNKAEFRERLYRSFMLRLKKSECLELPAKIEGLLTVGEGIPPIVSKLEKKVLEHYTKDDLVRERFEKDGAIHFAEYMKHLGAYKLKYVFPVIESLLSETNENILLFAFHKDVIDQLSLWLTNYHPIVITGNTPKEQRQKLVNEYQNSPKRRVFIGNFVACGLGFTITKATRVIFVEFSWRDGDNIQAADRAHRIGQDKTVLVQYTVLKNSYDAERMAALLEKRGNAV
jgi:SNF2 family DNA or RNA helicase